MYEKPSNKVIWFPVNEHVAKQLNVQENLAHAKAAEERIAMKVKDLAKKMKPRFQLGQMVEAVKATDCDCEVCKNLIAVVVSSRLTGDYMTLEYRYGLKDEDGNKYLAWERDVRRVSEMPEGWEPKESK
jgi:hypothetical protein